MDPAASVLGLGILFAIVAGIMNGIFTLPMKYLGRWSWENVWAVFILVSCVIMPVLIAWGTVPELANVLRSAPRPALVIACICGFAWGFGAIMFGQGVSALGISMANTLVLAISASIGSFLPILLLAPERLYQAQGKAIVLGTLIGVVGFACCGYAGLLRERSSEGNGERARGSMVGHARPFGVGLLLCAGSGVLSAVLNIGYSSAQPIIQTAVRMGHTRSAGSNLIWALLLSSGALPNLCFCWYLFRKNGSWKKYALPHSAPLYLLTIVMGLLWGGNVFVYGFASTHLGKLGPAIGWPLHLTTGLITANVCGFLTGEWRLARVRDRQWMGLGLVVLLAASAVLGWSSTLR